MNEMCYVIIYPRMGGCWYFDNNDDIYVYTSKDTFESRWSILIRVYIRMHMHIR